MKGPRIKKYLGFLVMALALILVAGQAKAGYIADRTTLESMLVGSFLQEDFEGVSVPGGTAAIFASPYVASSGAQFKAGPDENLGDNNLPNIQINDAGWKGQPSKDIMAYYSNTIEIDFTGVAGLGVDAFGIDLLAFLGNPFQDNSYNATIQVYGNDDSLLYEHPSIISVSDGFPITGVFFGFADETGTGIKEVVITGDAPGHPGSPIVDNLSFGAQVPVPGAVWLLGSGLLGLVGLRRKFKQEIN